MGSSIDKAERGRESESGRCEKRRAKCAHFHAARENRGTHFCAPRFQMRSPGLPHRGSRWTVARWGVTRGRMTRRRVTRRRMAGWRMTRWHDSGQLLLFNLFNFEHPIHLLSILRSGCTRGEELKVLQRPDRFLTHRCEPVAIRAGSVFWIKPCRYLF